jgi:hypothetical protein
MRNWITLVESFGTTQSLYHGTNIDNLCQIVMAGKLSADFHGRGYEGPTGVCLSRSFKIAHDHATTWAESLGDSFFDWFGIDQPPGLFGKVVLEFDRTKIAQEIIPYDDLGDDFEQEERVVGDLSLNALVAIYMHPGELEAFVGYVDEVIGKHASTEYSRNTREVASRILSDPRLKKMPS